MSSYTREQNNLRAIIGLSTLTAAWGGLSLHGAEQDNNRDLATWIKVLGSIGIIISLCFVGVFISTLLKLIEGQHLLNKNKIDKNKLSKNVKKYWDHMFGISITVMICGTIIILTTALLNEGFISGNTIAVGIIFFFGLGGTAVTLGLTGGLLIDKWPKTKKEEKTKEQEEEDNKLYKLIPGNQLLGGVLTGLFAVPILTILGTELPTATERMGRIQERLSDKHDD